MKRIIALMIGMMLSTTAFVEVNAQTAGDAGSQQVQPKGSNSGSATKNKNAKGARKPSKREKGKAEVKQAEQQRKASIGQGK